MNKIIADKKTEDDLTVSASPTSKIPITRPVFGVEEQLAVAEVLKSGWLVQGPRVQRFEEMVAEFVGCRHAVATTSCTAALHLSLLAAGVGPGNEVLAHALNEHIPIDHLEKASTFYALLPYVLEG